MRRSADLLRLLTQAERLMSRRLAVVLAAEGHTVEAWRVIDLLADGEGRFMTDVSEQAFLPPGTLTRLVDHLAEEALLYRRVDDRDRRRIRIFLTARGHRLHRRVDAEMQAGLADLPVDGEGLEKRLTALVDQLAGSGHVTGITLTRS